MKTPCIDVTNLNDFLGHDPRLCDMCEHREAAVLMLLRNAHDPSRFTHHALLGPKPDEHRSRFVCLTCFELVEDTGFDELVETGVHATAMTPEEVPN